MNSEELVTKGVSVDLGTSTQAGLAMECLENSDPKALKEIKEYFRLVLENLKAFDFSSSEEFTYELFFHKTEQMISARNEIVNVIYAIAEFCEDIQFYTELHDFFERILPYYYRRNEGDSSKTNASDHYKLFGYELFIYTVAALLKNYRFEQLNELTQQGYYVISENYHGNRFEYLNYSEFAKEPEALRRYYSKIRGSEENSRSIFLKGRVLEEKFKYQDLSQADFILFLISVINELGNETNNASFHYNVWNYQLSSESRIFEIFIRSESKYFFEKFRKCLRGYSREEFANALESYTEKVNISGFYYIRHNAQYLTNLQNIAKR